MKCKQCGECCQYIKFAFPNKGNTTRDWARWLSFHNCKVVISKKTTAIKINLPCKNLGYNSDSASYYCKDYGIRPAICREYVCKYIEGKSKTARLIKKGTA